MATQMLTSVNPLSDIIALFWLPYLENILKSLRDIESS
jgi:hypothetical protein